MTKKNPGVYHLELSYVEFHGQYPLILFPCSSPPKACDHWLSEINRMFNSLIGHPSALVWRILTTPSNYGTNFEN